MSKTSAGTKRKTSTPPDGYVCTLCQDEGHWIQQCPQLAKQKKKKSNHVPVPGVDPSQDDIERAKTLQKIKPPQCFCGVPSRLKKVKKSKIGGENSRAIGNYFFFCIKRKDDDPCRFARPVEDEIKPKKERLCTFFVKNGKCKKGDKCMFSHDIGSLTKKTNTKEEDSVEKDTVDKAEDMSEKEPIEKDDNDSDSSSDSSSDSDDDDDKVEDSEQ